MGHSSTGYDPGCVRSHANKRRGCSSRRKYMLSCEVGPFGIFVPQVAVVSAVVFFFLPPSLSPLCPLSVLLLEQSV